MKTNVLGFELKYEEKRMRNTLRVLLVLIFCFTVSATWAESENIKENNIKVIKDYYSAYASGDQAKLASYFDDNIVWNIPGHHPLAGQKKGKKEVMAFFTQLAKAKFKAEPIFFGANENYVVDIHRGWSNVEGSPNVDTMWALVFKIKNGKIIEATNLSGDQHQADAFFWSFYQLAPLPNRLKN